MSWALSPSGLIVHIYTYLRSPFDSLLFFLMHEYTLQDSIRDVIIFISLEWVEDVEANNNHIFTCRILMAGPKLHSGMVPRPDSQEILPFGKNRRGRRCRISMCFTCTHVLNDIYMHTHTPTHIHTQRCNGVKCIGIRIKNMYNVDFLCQHTCCEGRSAWATIGEIHGTNWGALDISSEGWQSSHENFAA